MRYNYYQPMVFSYDSALTEGITGYVMPFPNIEVFNAYYGEVEENAPTGALIDTLRLLSPQFRSIRRDLTKPAAFLAYEKVDPAILSLIFQRWVEVCYPAEVATALAPYYAPDQFVWSEATPNDINFWAPAWAFAWKLTEHEYELGHQRFRFLIGPRNSGNSVELVSWPPLESEYGYKSSISLIVSTQSDIRNRKIVKRINLHFGMKRWVLPTGDRERIR
ncbi:MAG: DUF3962 domain-containing protein, partial [Cyanobacteria bacterium P01_D01_bin.56]